MLNEVLATVYSVVGAALLGLLGVLSVKLKNYLKNSRILKFMEAKEKDRSFLESLAFDLLMTTERRFRLGFNEYGEDKYNYLKDSLVHHINKVSEERGLDLKVDEEDVDEAILKVAESIGFEFEDFDFNRMLEDDLLKENVLKGGFSEDFVGDDFVSEAAFVEPEEDYEGELFDDSDLSGGAVESAEDYPEEAEKEEKRLEEAYRDIEDDSEDKGNRV